MAPPHGILTNKKYVPPTVDSGLVEGRGGTSRGGWVGMVRNAACYFS